MALGAHQLIGVIGVDMMLHHHGQRDLDDLSHVATAGYVTPRRNGKTTKRLHKF